MREPNLSLPGDFQIRAVHLCVGGSLNSTTLDPPDPCAYCSPVQAKKKKKKHRSKPSAFSHNRSKLPKPAKHLQHLPAYVCTQPEVDISPAASLQRLLKTPRSELQAMQCL